MSLNRVPRLSIYPGHILFVIGSLEVGGTEKQLVTLVNGLMQLGVIGVDVFALDASGPLRDQVHAKVHDGGVRGSMRRKPWRMIVASWRLFQLIRRTRPQILHAYLPLITFIGALLGRLCKVPMVITAKRALGTHQDRRPILKPLDRIANRLSHKITVNSVAVYMDTVDRDGVDPHKLELIYNGVRTPRCGSDMYWGSPRTTIITVANLIRYKGHTDLLKAIDRVVCKGHHVNALIVGEDRGMLQELKDMAYGWCLKDNVSFLGQRDDVSRLFSISDIAVLPSHEEGFSNAILEAMAHGLPVVAYDVGGNNEAVNNGITGYLVPDGDYVAMADRIIDLIENPGRALSMGDSGIERASYMFNIHRMIDKHVSLYWGE